MSLRSHCLGDFSKPRPALVLQRWVYPETENVTVALITSDLLRAPNIRIIVVPDDRNGLRKPSEVMADNVQTIRTQRIGAVIGSLDEATMHRVNAALMIFLGLDQ
ncbi:MAG TPA: type II toxin-antitoxin system PemK/MazF family toxin [Acidobacteriaceae bacterium]